MRGDDEVGGTGRAGVGSETSWQADVELPHGGLDVGGRRSHDHRVRDDGGGGQEWGGWEVGKATAPAVWVWAAREATWEGSERRKVGLLKMASRLGILSHSVILSGPTLQPCFSLKASVRLLREVTPPASSSLDLGADHGGQDLSLEGDVPGDERVLGAACAVGTEGVWSDMGDSGMDGETQKTSRCWTMSPSLRKTAASRRRGGEPGAPSRRGRRTGGGS